ncbi:MAG TPA: four helix bundle protein [Geobacteraceae bacterium]
MGKKGFRELLVWQRGRELAVLVYQLTSSNHFSHDYSLRDQMRRAAISIPSNIAEGDERETDKEAIRSFYVAKGSAAELLTQALIAQDIGYLNQQQVETLSERCADILRMLANLIRARSRSPRTNPISAG